MICTNRPALFGIIKYYEQENIHTPLSEDHATWLQAADLKSRFQCDYRGDDLDAGYHYLNHFIECIEDAADRADWAALT